MIKRLMKHLAGNPVGTSLGLIALCIQLATNLSGGYGYFRDEFYYIACTDHLAWGYVDHPPFSELLLWLNRVLLGDSIFALRLLPAVAAAALVYLAGLIVREMGGGKTAQLLACLAVIIAPV
jgi:4-amino-4-deoxy-L-arabinose transferase-like glycosyltransferase